LQWSYEKNGVKVKKTFKVAAAMFCLLLATTCTPIHHIYKTYKIDADTMRQQCNEPSEAYPIPLVPYGVAITVMRFEQGCLGVDDILVGMWGGRDDEYNETVTRLMILLYINSHNTQNEKQLARIFLKKDSFSDNTGEMEAHMLIYELVEESSE
jgi:hypothetical protein